MKRMRAWGWLPVAALLATGAVSVSRAQELVIDSFDSPGRLTFQTTGSATNYWVEWASSPAGPWTNLWESLVNITHLPPVGVITCSVPMCYRVVAHVIAPEGMVLIPSGSFQMGDKYWSFYKPRLEQMLLAKQGTDGSWLSPGGHERNAGKAYCTAMAILALSVGHHYLPIYQR